MLRIKYWLLGVVVAFCATLGHAADINITYSLTPSEDGMMRLSYNLSDPGNKLFDALRDAVRGNNRVLVRHKVVISPVGGLWGELASATQTYYVSYDVLRESYEVGEQVDQVSLTTQDEGTAAHMLLGVRDLPIVEARQIYKGQEYKLSIEADIEVPTRSRWVRWLPFKWFGKDELNVEAFYLAR